MDNDHAGSCRSQGRSTSTGRPAIVLQLMVGLLTGLTIASWCLEGGEHRISSFTVYTVDHASSSVPRRHLSDPVAEPPRTQPGGPAGSNCSNSCGNVSIPYPFGLTPECARSPYFQLDCRDVSGLLEGSGIEIPSGFWPFLRSVSGSFVNNLYNSTAQTPIQGTLQSVDSFRVLSIVGDNGTLIIDNTEIKATSCNSYDPTLNVSSLGNASIVFPADGPYRITSANVFFVVGCDSGGQYSGTSISDGQLYNENPSCGPNACQNQFTYAFCNAYDCCTMSLQTMLEMHLVGGGGEFQYFSTCGFSSVLYPPSYSTDSFGTIGRGTYGLEVLWALDVNQSLFMNCSTTSELGMPRDYACSLNSNCTFRNVSYDDAFGNSIYMPGYFCFCEKGYFGDGYVNGTGCTDVDECLSQDTNKCAAQEYCRNLPGTYNCSCPRDMVGDGRNVTDNGSGCVTKKTSHTALIAGLTVSGIMLFITINSLVIWYLYRKRQKAFLDGPFGASDFSRREFLLEIQSKEGANICKLYTFEELSKATNNFSIDGVLGTGGFGTVYEGTLDDGTKLAIKRAKHDVGGARDDTKQFINEVTILSQVNHRNLVKLLGCCLETPVPVLIYEFISNGNLEDHLRRPKPLLDENGKRTEPPRHWILDWNKRLKIAIDTAEALAYLHFGTSPPIYHRDVKTANILLDENYVAKVADFGLSKFVPLEATHVSTAIQGTPGYLDPEYFDNYQITDKSDVYSFGVVLLELVTAQKPVDLSQPARDHNLALRCNRLIKHGRLEDIIDPVLGASATSDPKMLEVVHSVAQVAMKCVERHREDRPTMKEVLEELQFIARSTRKNRSAHQKEKLMSSKAVRFESDSGSNIVSGDSASDSIVSGMFTNSQDFYFSSDQSSSLNTSSSAGMKRGLLELFKRH